MAKHCYLGETWLNLVKFGYTWLFRLNLVEFDKTWVLRLNLAKHDYLN